MPKSAPSPLKNFDLVHLCIDLPGFSVLKIFKAIFHSDGPSALNPGSTVPQKSPLIDFSGKHPVSALMEVAVKRRWGAPAFSEAFACGPSHSKQFIYKVCSHYCSLSELLTIFVWLDSGVSYLVNELWVDYRSTRLTHFKEKTPHFACA